MIDWNAQEARQLRENGMSWTDIGRRFGVCCSTAHARLDPVFARRRQDDINARRSAARIAKPTEPAFYSEVIETEPGRKVYSVDRIRLTDNGFRRTRISLPFVSIQHPASVRPA